MKVLLIAYSYPPDPMVGSFRPAKVARAFRDAGHEVHVVTGRMPGEKGQTRVSDPGITVHTVSSFKNPRHGFLWLRGVVRQMLGRPLDGPMKDSAAAAAAAADGPGITSSSWKRYIISLLWVPDENQGFIPGAVVRGLSVARGGLDLIYATAPPFSDHLAGRALKALTGVPWVMELRDPWSGNASRDREARSGVADRLNGWLEKRCLASADRVIAVSSPVMEQVSGVLGGSGKLSLVLNGIDEIESCLPERSDDVFRILHTGSLYNDPRPFLRAVATVAQRMRLDARKLRVEFIGAVPPYANPTPMELAEELGIAEIVSFAGWIPQPACRARIRNADLLLLLCEGFVTAIPNKLFDYLGSRKPILGIVDAEGESAQILRDAEGHFLATTNSMGAVEAALEQAVHERVARKRLLNDESFLKSWSTEEQMKRLISSLDALVDAQISVGFRRHSMNSSNSEAC